MLTAFGNPAVCIQPTIVMYDAILKKDYKTGRWNAFVGGFFFGLSQFLQFGAQALVLWYGFKLVKEGQITSISRMLQVLFFLLLYNGLKLHFLSLTPSLFITFLLV